jgi:hypothetical protein
MYQVSDALFFIHQPNTEDKYLADEIYKSVREKSLYEGMYTDNDIQLILSDTNMWTQKEEDKLKKMEKQLETLKVTVYENRLNAKQVKILISSIIQTEDIINRLHNTRHSLDYLTADGHASMIRRQFLVFRTVTDATGQRILGNDFWNSDFKMLERIFFYIAENQLGATEIRGLSRCDLWRQHWDISKPTPFSQHYVEWGEEQRLLVRFSKMYDNIYAHPECPSDEVIENDYMLDGWMIIQHREREKKQNEVEGKDIVSSSVGRHQEVFVMAQNKEHAEKINNLNNQQAKSIKKEREQLIVTKGKVKESQLPDVQRDIMLKQK